MQAWLLEEEVVPICLSIFCHRVRGVRGTQKALLHLERLAERIGRGEEF